MSVAADSRVKSECNLGMVGCNPLAVDISAFSESMKSPDLLCFRTVCNSAELLAIDGNWRRS